MAGATVAQLADAEAHGAGNSPEFKQRRRELVESTIALRNQMHADGQSTDEFDQRLEADLRRIAEAVRSKAVRAIDWLASGIPFSQPTPCATSLAAFWRKPAYGQANSLPRLRLVQLRSL